MRERKPFGPASFRAATIFVGFAVAMGLLAVFIPWALGSNRDLSPSELAIVVGITVVASGVGLALSIAIQRRLVGDRIEVAVRDEHGKWRHGRLEITPAHFLFQPYAWQTRIPRGPARGLDVLHVSHDTGRRPPLRQIWSINPFLHVITVSTVDGEHELAVMPKQIPTVRRRLAL